MCNSWSICDEFRNFLWGYFQKCSWKPYLNVSKLKKIRMWAFCKSSIKSTFKGNRWMLSIKGLYCSLPYISRLISNCRQKMILDRYSDRNFFFEFTYLKLKSVLHLTTYLQHMSLIFLFFVCLCIGLSLISLKFLLCSKEAIMPIYHSVCLSDSFT